MGRLLNKRTWDVKKFRFILNIEPIWNVKKAKHNLIPRICFRAIKKPGAGYIGGWTFFFAYKSCSSEWENRHRGKRLPFLRLQIGLTKNANKIPYA